jgi:hypothetical protein
MATAVARRVFPWWQFGSPVSMLLALVLFALPWVEVRCDRPLGERGSRTLARQSGLQAAYGGYSEVALQDVDRSERERMEARVRAVRGEPGTDWSPLLVAYPLVLIGGGVLGLLARRERLRRAAAVACSLAAGLLFLVQAFRGLPLERAVRAVGTQGNLAGADFRIALSGERLLEVRHTPWFWLSAGALVVAAALACGGGPWGSRTRSLRHDVGL